MTVVNAIPQLWAAAFERQFDAATVWAGLTRDLSGEFANGGDRLHLNEVTSGVTVRDYTRNTALEAPERATTSDLVLRLNREKYFRIAVDDVDQVQVRGDLLAEVSRKAGVSAAAQFDTDLYTTFNTEWDDDGADRTRFEHAKTPAEPDAAWRQSLVDAGFAIVRRMNELNIPREGRWCVITTETEAHFLDYLIKDKSTLGAGARIDRALAEAAIGQLFGCNIIVDTNLPTAAAQNNPYMLFGINSWGAYGRQIGRVEAVRPADGFEDQVKGLYVYGSVAVHPQRKFAVVQAA